MDVSQIVIGSIPALAQYVLAPATIILVLFLMLIYWRSGSSHALLLKTWLVVLGQTTINSKVIKQFAADELDLTHFRYLTGITVSTLKEAERLFLWAHERDIGLRLVRKAGRHIDVARPGPALSLFALSRWHLYWRLLPLVALTAILAMLLILAQYERAVITVRSTDRHFTVDRQYASPLMGGGKFNFRDCSTAAKSEIIDNVSLKVLCEMSTEPKIEAKLAAIVSDQHLISWAASLYLTLPLILSFVSVVRVHSALQVRKKLEWHQQAQRTTDTSCAQEETTPELFRELNRHA